MRQGIKNYIILSAILLCLVMATSYVVYSMSNSQWVVQASRSMEPTINAGQRLLMEYFESETTVPTRWDVVVFVPPVMGLEEPKNDELWMFRVVGLPGDELSFDTNDQLLINGVPAVIPQHLKGVSYSAPDRRMGQGVRFPIIVGETEVFLLGDNPQANDSRFIGPVPIHNVKGRVSYTTRKSAHEPANSTGTGANGKREPSGRHESPFHGYNTSQGTGVRHEWH